MSRTFNFRILNALELLPLVESQSKTIWPSAVFRLPVSKYPATYLLVMRDLSCHSQYMKGDVKSLDPASYFKVLFNSRELELVFAGESLTTEQLKISEMVSDIVKTAKQRMIDELLPDLADKVWGLAEAMQGEIAAEIRVMLGEAKLAQSLFTPEQQQRRIQAMKLCASQNVSDEQRHASWMAMHVDAGWTWGPEFDPVNKKHPNLVSWDELPDEVKVKAKIFDIISRTFAEVIRSVSF